MVGGTCPIKRESDAVRLDAFITSPGFEGALEGELQGASGPRWPGVLSREAQAVVPDAVFCRQVLPAATLIKGDSVSALAQAAFAAVGDTAFAAVGDTAFAAVGDTRDGGESPIVVHAFVPDQQRYSTIDGRARLIGDSFVALVKQRRRRAFKRLLGHEESRTVWPTVTLIQLGLVGRTSLLVSWARPSRLPTGGHDLAPRPAGLAPVVADRAAPSRAYGKLEESFAWMATAPSTGETCVDLGGAPGGWAWKALQRGAKVTVVDRSPLSPPAAGHPNLTTIIGNAFTYEPDRPVDWLLCDVICEPARTLALVDRWIGKALCRRLVATVKFKGGSDYGILQGVSQRIFAAGWSFARTKHLYRHHNEVSIMARR